MGFYDNLPRQLRDALKDCADDMSATDARTYLSKGFPARELARLFPEHAHLNYQDTMREHFGEEVGRAIDAARHSVPTGASARIERADRVAQRRAIRWLRKWK
jgi:hypothetical protein